MKALCALPLYNYGDPARGVTIDYESFVPALEALGYEVHFVDTWNAAAYPSYSDLNEAILEAVERLHPTVFFSIQRDFEIWIETLEQIRRRGDVTLITWTTDDSFKFDKVSRFIAPYYDAISTTYDYRMKDYERLGIAGAIYTQWAANAHWLQEPVPALECKYPVTFIGTSYGARSEIVQRVKDAGLPIECFGFGWPNGPIATEQIPEIMRASQISLNFSAGFQGADDKNQQLKARTFEVPGAGGFLLTDPGYGLEKVYQIGKEIEVFRNTEELIEKIRYYLARPEERDSIARAGYVRTRDQHTYVQRLEEILKFGFGRFQARKDNSLPPVMLPRRGPLTLMERLYKSGLTWACRLVWKQRGEKAARRFTFALSRRLFGVRTFSSRSLPGRLFPYV